MQGHHGHQSASMARFDHAAIVIESGSRELARGGFNSCPLDRKPVRVETQRLNDVQVILVAVPRVTRITTGGLAQGVGLVFISPPVAIGIAALDLVGRCRGSPVEVTRKRKGWLRTHDLILSSLSVFGAAVRIDPSRAPQWECVRSSRFPRPTPRPRDHRGQYVPWHPTR